jgi:hypothetical protein
MTVNRISPIVQNRIKNYHIPSRIPPRQPVEPSAEEPEWDLPRWEQQIGWTGLVLLIVFVAFPIQLFILLFDGIWPFSRAIDWFLKPDEENEGS